MDVLTKEEFNSRLDFNLRRIDKGQVFVHPTDTIYGIGCNALEEGAVKRIRAIKKRGNAPFSVIVPSKKWIYDNCIVLEEGIKWVEKLPGPYTLVFKLSSKDAVDKTVNNGMDTIGVRMPAHWFSDVVAKLGVPVVTTSVNISGEEPMSSIDDLDEWIRGKLDFIIYEGEKKGHPSIIVSLIEEKAEIIKRKK